MQKIKTIILALVICIISSAAFVHGDIVKSQSDPSNKTLIRIEGKFTYQMITNSSNYSIFLPDGEYSLNSYGIDQHGEITSSVSNKLNIGADDQRIDILLKKNDNFTLYFLSGIVILAVIALSYVYMKKNSSPKPQIVEEEIIEETQLAEIKKEELDEEAKKVIAVIESNDKRITQKELRETLGFSEAKLSLILSELESIGVVKKFKRGRGNIVKKI